MARWTPRLEVVAALVLDFDEHDAVLAEIDDHVRLGKRIWVFSEAGAQLAQTPLDLLSAGTGVDRCAPQEEGRCCHQGAVGNQSGLPQGAQQLTGAQKVHEDHPGHGVFRGGKAKASPLGFAVAYVERLGQCLARTLAALDRDVPERVAVYESYRAPVGGIRCTNAARLAAA